MNTPGFQINTDVAVKLVVTLLLATPYAAQAEGQKEAPKPTGDVATQSIMHSIFQPLSIVLPLSFDYEAFTATANRAKIQKQLKTLSDNAQNLEKHSLQKERGFEFVAKSLAFDARRLDRWYARGRFEEAQFILLHITDNCLECHSRYPENHKFPKADKFFADVKLEKLMPLDRAHLFIVSRQFDDALKEYETIFAAKDSEPSSIIMLNAFTDYLKICIQVKNDLTRPTATLAKIMARPDTPPLVGEQLQRWQQTLAKMSEAKVLEKTDIDTARGILNDGRAIMEYPRDRDALIQFITAGALLNRYIHGHPDRGADVAEAYYLLGISESLIGHSFWISPMEFDFESAIRLAPAAAFAPKAYAMLEEAYTVGFSGSSGTNIPDDVRSLLLELREIIKEAKGSKS